MKKKVLYILPPDCNESIIKYVLYLIDLYEYDFDIYCIQWIEKGKEYNLAGPIWERILSKFQILANPEDGYETILEIKPDIIHFHEHPDQYIDFFTLLLLYGYNNLAEEFDRKRSYYFIISPHSMHLDLDKVMFCSDKFVVPTKALKRIYEKHYKTHDVEFLSYQIEDFDSEKISEVHTTEKQIDVEESQQKLTINANTTFDLEIKESNSLKEEEPHLTAEITVQHKISEDEICIVTSHADTEYRKFLLENCIKSIQCPIILSTNYPVDTKLQTNCDYYLYDKKNPLLYKEEYSSYGVYYNYLYKEDGVEKAKSFDYEHSYAVYLLIKNGLDLAKRNGFKKVHVINYDYEINYDLLSKHSKLIEQNEFVVYHHDNDRIDKKTTDRPYCTGFFSANINSALKFFNKFKTKDEFYQNWNLLEQRFANFIRGEIQKYHELSFLELENICKANQEGLLEFSKSDGFKTNETEKSIELKENRKSLSEISNEVQCEKSTRHQFDLIYPQYIEKFRDEEISILELGIDKGTSYHVWTEYFTKAEIYGLDINQQFVTKRGKVITGDQTNFDDLNRIMNQIKFNCDNCKLIVDDASHLPEHQLTSFYFLFKNLLKPGGVYIIEVTECSYWSPEQYIYGYKKGYLNLIDYFTKLNHEVNWRYNGLNNELDINTITFGPNCIIITKIDYPKRNRLT